eukprot:1962646-Rhodomonas_salina.1
MREGSWLTSQPQHCHHLSVRAGHCTREGSWLTSQPADGRVRQEAESFAEIRAADHPVQQPILCWTAHALDQSRKEEGGEGSNLETSPRKSAEIPQT